MSLAEGTDTLSGLDCSRSLGGSRSDDFAMTGTELLSALPAAVYTTDAAGRITSYNDAAAELWGMRPVLGKTAYCGSWKLYAADGVPMPHDQCPMALTIKGRCAIRGAEAIAERPDGSRVSFLAYPTPVFDESGTLTGAVSMLVDITARKGPELALQRLAAIVESSDDAIVSKDLDGTITSWNRGAERLFGYTAAETVGRPITMLIPDDRLDEEPIILARLRLGERIEHYETVRRRKDGSLVDISLTVSPIRDSAGTVVGASKIARDITERRRSEERQRLLLNEMNHRVKNLLVLAGGVVALSARSAGTAQELAADVRERLGALARAHDLTLPRAPGLMMTGEPSTSLHALIATIVSPFDVRGADGATRVRVSGSDCPIASGGPLTSLALLLHEFATNAAKYGALSTPAGSVEISCADEGNTFVLLWAERGGPRVRRDSLAEGEGFGSLLARATVRGQLAGEITRDWQPDGLVIRLSVNRARLVG